MKPVVFKLFSFCLKTYKRIVLLSVAAGLVAGGVSATLIVIVGVRIADFNATPGALVGPFILLALISLTLNFASGLFSTYSSQKSSFDLRMRLSRQILTAPLSQLEEIGPHRVMAGATQDIPAISNACVQIPQACIHSAVLVGCAVYLAWLSPTYLGVLVALIVLAIISIKTLERRAATSLKLAREDYDQLTSHFRALTDGAKEFKLHHARREAFLSQVVQTTARSLRHHNLSSGKAYAFITGWGQTLYFVIIGLILFALPLLESDTTRQIVSGYAITVLYMEGHISTLMVILPTLVQGGVSLQKIEELGLSLGTVDAGINQPLVGSPYASFSGETIELKEVIHRYYHESEDNDFMLGPINLTLHQGELVFIIGDNGSGKSTLAKILTGLYIPESGQIHFNGEPVTHENRDYYREHFSVVFTDFFICEQLLGLDERNLDERAQDYLANLKLDHKVTVKNGRLSTVALSHGQRKRLALLIAYLEDRPIYLFDEWDSNQDPAFKETFYLHLLPELKARGKTIIVISHDDNYLQLADRIIKIDYGTIVNDTYRSCASVGAL